MYLHGDFEFILICKQKCFVCFTTIRDFSRIRQVLYHFVFTTYRAETFAFAEYLRCGYYLMYADIAEHEVDHPALLFALRFILLCQTRIRAVI